MNRFRTTVDISDPGFSLGFHDPCMLLGSCFSESMGERLIRYKFPAACNPFGVLYNPASIARSLRMLLEGRRFKPEDLLHHNGLFLSLDPHSAYSHLDRERCLAGINRSLRASAHHLKRCRLLVLTFGTAWIYIHKESGRTAANCHKLPSAACERRLLEPEEIGSDYERLFRKLKAACPELRILFWISRPRSAGSRPGGETRGWTSSGLFACDRKLQNGIRLLKAVFNSLLRRTFF